MKLRFPSQRSVLGFTLPEVLIAASIFAVVSAITANLYVNAYREMKRANTQNQIFEDARIIMERIAQEVRGNAIDYDEYFNQNVILGGATPQPSGSQPYGLQNYGQNFGRYFSSFFNPGNDEALGFDCNNAPGAGTAYIVPNQQRDAKRNLRECTPLRSTLDRNTGENPFLGKFVAGVNTDENAFCASVGYALGGVKNNRGTSPDGRAMCNAGSPDMAQNRVQPELYLIAADGSVKTILTREKINQNPDRYALSVLELKGFDTDNNGIFDRFVCMPGYQCRSADDVVQVNDGRPATMDCGGSPQELPRSRALSLDHANDACDTAAHSFGKDFVPISPFRVDIQNLNFYIAPLEDPFYTYGEAEVQFHPRVTIQLTVAPNPAYISNAESFQQVTLVETISTGVRNPIPTPLLVL